MEQVLTVYVVNEETYPDNAVIIEEGTRTDWAYVILEGHVKVRKMTSTGMVTLGTLKEGDIFGEMVLLRTSVGVRTASIIAEGPVRVGVLDRERLRREFEMLQPILKDLIGSLNLKLEATNKEIASLTVELGD